MLAALTGVLSRVQCFDVQERLRELLRKEQMGTSIAESNCQVTSDRVVYHTPPGANAQRLMDAVSRSRSPHTNVEVERKNKRNEFAVHITGQDGKQLTSEDLETIVEIIKTDLQTPVRQYAYSHTDEILQDAFGSIVHSFFSDFQQERLHPHSHSQPEPAKNRTPDTKGTSKQLKEALQQLGCTVTLPEETTGTATDTWESLAGYAELKTEIQDSIIAPIAFPEAFQELQTRTRDSRAVTPVIPRVILFTGPPGLGKTSSARIIANSTKQPFVYLPIEAVASKWYGESESTLSQIFQLADKLAKTYSSQKGRCLLFIDEVETLAGSRDADMHEVSRKLLSVLLKTIDGFKQSDITLIAATNRRSDLDAAFVSRCDVILNFPFPDNETRKLIWAKYAKHLNPDEIATLAEVSGGFSGRNIRDTAAQVERTWVATWARGDKRELGTPTLAAYSRVIESKKLEDSKIRRVSTPLN